MGLDEIIDGIFIDQMNLFTSVTSSLRYWSFIAQIKFSWSLMFMKSALGIKWHPTFITTANNTLRPIIVKKSSTEVAVGSSLKIIHHIFPTEQRNDYRNNNSW